jgi:hypothetical protein
VRDGFGTCLIVFRIITRVVAGVVTGVVARVVAGGDEVYQHHSSARVVAVRRTAPRKTDEDVAVGPPPCRTSP